LSKSNGDAPVRLQLYLARCGLGSRRSCETLIEQGRVSINGVAVARAGEKVAASDTVTVNGRKVTPSSSLVYLAVHKPREFLCANADPEHRPLVSDLFSRAVKERLFHVGRLDFLSTGLILYTNDGAFSKLVSHPATRIEKEYLVETARDVDEDLMRRYAKGIRVGEVTYHCTRYTLRGPRSVLITLVEGKNREIRNVFASRNIRLKRVHRLRIGPVTLQGMAPGHFRRLTPREVSWFLGRTASPPPRRPLRRDTPHKETLQRAAPRPETSSSRGTSRGRPRNGPPKAPRKSTGRPPGRSPRR
jgi:23S rRNA pseudouridine2605 synthase